MPSARESTTTLDFIRRHSVFTLDELLEALGTRRRSPLSIRRSLEHHLREGRLVSVRRGVYAQPTWVSPWLLASKLAEDAIVSHDGALSFHRLTGVGHRVCFMTTQRTSVARYHDVIYQPVRVQRRHSGQYQRHEGQEIRVTSLPHTLVDCLASLDHAPELPELLSVFESVRTTVDPSALIRHARSYDSPLLIARLAFFLTCARFELGTSDIQTLGRLGPQVPTHFRRSTRARGDTLVGKWNLIVPPELLAFWPAR